MAREDLPDTSEIVQEIAAVVFRSPSHKLHRLLQVAAQHCFAQGWEVDDVSYHRTEKETVLTFYISGNRQEIT